MGLRWVLAVSMLLLTAGCSAGPGGDGVRLECHVPADLVPAATGRAAETGVRVSWIVEGREKAQTVLSRTPFVLTADLLPTIVQRVDADGTVWLKRGILPVLTPLRTGEDVTAGHAFIRNVTDRPDIGRVAAVITLLRVDSEPAPEIRRRSTSGSPRVELDCEVRHLDVTAGRIVVTGAPPLVADDWPNRDTRRILRTLKLLAIDESGAVTVEIAGETAVLAPGESLGRLIRVDRSGRVTAVDDPETAAARIDVTNRGGGWR